MALLDYAHRALDAIGWRWGACHIELKLAPNIVGPPGSPSVAAAAEEKGAEGLLTDHRLTPVLIEINAGRWNGVDFKLLASACTGHDAYEATLDAYLDEEAWDAVPSAPPDVLRGFGRLVKLVSGVSGTLTAAPGSRGDHAEALEAMPSLVRFEPDPCEPGERVSATVDLSTCAGFAHLLHACGEVVERDYRSLRGLQPTLFEAI